VGTVERASEVEANLGLGFVPIYKSSTSTEPWVSAYLSLKVSLYACMCACMFIVTYVKELRQGKFSRNLSCYVHT